MAANDRMLNFKSVSCFSGDICRTLDFNEVISKAVNEKLLSYLYVITLYCTLNDPNLDTLGKYTLSNSEVSIQYPTL